MGSPLRLSPSAVECFLREQQSQNVPRASSAHSPAICLHKECPSLCIVKLLIREPVLRRW